MLYELHFMFATSSRMLRYSSSGISARASVINLGRAQLVDNLQTAPFLGAEFGGDVGASIATLVDKPLVDEPGDYFT